MKVVKSKVKSQNAKSFIVRRLDSSSRADKQHSIFFDSRNLHCDIAAAVAVF